MIKTKQELDQLAGDNENLIVLWINNLEPNEHQVEVISYLSKKLGSISRMTIKSTFGLLSISNHQEESVELISDGKQVLTEKLNTLYEEYDHNARGSASSSK